MTCRTNWAHSDICSDTCNTLTKPRFTAIWMVVAVTVYIAPCRSHALQKTRPPNLDHPLRINMVLIFLRKFAFHLWNILSDSRVMQLELTTKKRLTDDEASALRVSQVLWQAKGHMVFQVPRCNWFSRYPGVSGFPGTQVYLVFQVTRYPSPLSNSLSLAFFKSQSLLLNVKVMLSTKTDMTVWFWITTIHRSLIQLTSCMTALTKDRLPMAKITQRPSTSTADPLGFF